MNTIIRTITKTLLVAAVSLPMAAHALVIEFEHEGDLYATLTTSDATNFDLFFIGTGSADAFMNDLFLEGPDGTFANLAGTESPATATFSLNGFNELGNLYDWKIDFPQPNDINRLTTGEHALFSITVTDPDLWNLGLIHINAFDGEESIKLIGVPGGDDPVPVPEPATLTLLGLGLLGIGLARRRRTT